MWPVGERTRWWCQWSNYSHRSGNAYFMGK